MKRYAILVAIMFFLFANRTSAQLFQKVPTFDARANREAERLWKDGKFAEAEKMMVAAYERTGVVNHIGILARLKWEIGDVKGYNAVADKVIQHNLNQYAKSDLLMYRMAVQGSLDDKFTKNVTQGDPIVGLKTGMELLDLFGDKINDSENGYFYSFYSKAPEIAFLTDDKATLEKMHRKVSSIKNAKIAEVYTYVYLGMANKQYDSVIARLLDIEKNGSGFMGSKWVARVMLATVYTYKGDNEEALKWIAEAKKNIMTNDSFFKDLYGQIALNQKKYPEAVEKLTNALKGRTVLWAHIEPVSKYKLYYQRGLAYMGINEVQKAKKDFEASLVYNKTYTPSINALASLEGKMITDRITDKTPPKISILEPAVTRGLKVTTSAKDVMVKGLAEDPSGLKSVLINGTSVYSTEKGDFWGSVLLKEGNNQLTIVATDLAGNSIEEIFEVERQQATAQTSSDDIIPAKQKEGKNFALLIASQNYTDPAIPSLENPIADAVKLKLALKNNYNFQEENIYTLFNPDISDFRKKFLQISENLDPDDNLIIFYAGHGIWVDKDKKGYWLLTDAQRNDVNTWLPNKEVLGMIAEVPARHTLLITDACFSGSVFKTRGLSAEAPAALREMSEKISRVAITSGNDSEVPDESVFMKHLIKALNENKEKYFTAQKMFITQILEAVMSETKTEPRYGTLELSGHVGGDFIFVKK
ncbi:MAG: caspase family protein [Sediminibacterium sp.]|nr:caspase family protein [Sediminibacterium sp.]